MHTQIKAETAGHIEIANIAFQVVTITLVGMFSLAGVVQFIATAMV